MPVKKTALWRRMLVHTITAGAIAVTSLAQDAAAYQGQRPKKEITKLLCSGLLYDYERKALDVPISGVYVTIDGNLVRIYNLATFPDYETGMTFIVSGGNPSKLTLKNRSNANVSSSINRISGDIDIVEARQNSSNMLRFFKGKCINAKPVF